MYAQSLNTYATPVPTVFNSTLSSAFENAKFTLANGPNDLLTLLGNKATVTADANTTLVQNRDCTALILNTANRVYTLPPLAGQVFPILIEKTSNNFFTITVNRNAAPDTIENPFEATAVPVNTSLTLKLPGEAYLFIPSGTYWRVVTLNCPVNQYRCEVFRSSNQALGTGIFDRVNFNSEVVDSGSFFDNVTNFRATPLIAGIYIVNYSVVFLSGASSNSLAHIRKNGTNTKLIGQFTTTVDTGFSGMLEVSMNGTTDYIDCSAYSGTAGKSIFGSTVAETALSVSLKTRI